MQRHMVETREEIVILTKSEEIFNHVDDNEEMWAGEGPRTIEYKVVFDKVFAAPPAVVVGLTGIDSSASQNLRFNLTTKDISAQGFTVSFHTWSDTMIARASVGWSAVGVK